MDDSGLIQTILDFTSFDIVDSLGNIHGDRAGLRVRHEALRAEHTTDTADETHHIRGRNADVEIEPVFLLDLGDHIFSADIVSTGSQSFLGLVALGEHKNADNLTSSVGQNNCATDLLVCMTGVNTKTDGDFNSLIELGFASLNNKITSLIRIILIQMVNQLYAVLVFLTMLHYYSSHVVLAAQRPPTFFKGLSPTV